MINNHIVEKFGHKFQGKTERIPASSKAIKRTNGGLVTFITDYTCLNCGLKRDPWENLKWCEVSNKEGKLRRILI